MFDTTSLYVVAMYSPMHIKQTCWHDFRHELLGSGRFVDPSMAPAGGLHPCGCLHTWEILQGTCRYTLWASTVTENYHLYTMLAHRNHDISESAKSNELGFRKLLRQILQNVSTWSAYYDLMHVQKAEVMTTMHTWCLKLLPVYGKFGKNLS